MTEHGRLEGKRALITGGGRGIGAAIARRLAGDGAAVAINYVSDTHSADALVEELTAAGHRAVAFQADVSDPEQTQDLVARVVAEFGGVDLLASNAGVEYFGALESITAADFDRVFHVNVAGQLFATQAAAAVMRAVAASCSPRRSAPGSRCISTRCMPRARPPCRPWCSTWRPNSPSAASRSTPSPPAEPRPTWRPKHAPSYTPPSLRDVAPENILKAVYALGRRAEPSEIAAIASFLLSADASYVTGATIDASGGRM